MVKRNHFLAAIALTCTTPVALLGCGESTPTPPAEALKIEGDWLFLGPGEVGHSLKISAGSMVYTGDDAWSSSWTIKTYDNDLHHFQLTFRAGTGTYFPVGQNVSGTYDLGGTLLTIQVATGASYPVLQSPGTCTNAMDGAAIPDCGLYIKPN